MCRSSEARREYKFKTPPLRRGLVNAFPCLDAAFGNNALVGVVITLQYNGTDSDDNVITATVLELCMKRMQTYLYSISYVYARIIFGWRNEKLPRGKL